MEISTEQRQHKHPINTQSSSWLKVYDLCLENGTLRFGFEQPCPALKLSVVHCISLEINYKIKRSFEGPPGNKKHSQLYYDKFSYHPQFKTQIRDAKMEGNIHLKSDKIRYMKTAAL